MLTTRDIVSQITADDVPFYFTEIQGQFFSTRIMTKDELSFFGRKDAEEKPLGVYLLDAPIDEVLEHLRKESQYNVDTVIELISTKYNAKIINCQVIITFMILHEIGHWRHFIETGMTGKDYWSCYGVEEDMLIKQYYALVYLNQSSATQIHEHFASQYRHLPMEVIADEYALSELSKYI